MTQGKDFEVLVCETAPQFKGHKTAKSLQEEGIDAKLITDSSVYALMSGVDKVIISRKYFKKFINFFSSMELNDDVINCISNNLSKNYKINELPTDIK